jgi:type II secretory pathway pseudopilin PulG
MTDFNRHSRCALRRATQRPRSRCGYTIVELVATMAFVGITAGLVLPELMAWSSKTRVNTAAGELVGTLRMARTFAMRHSAHVAVKFDTTSRAGAVHFALFRDGDGDGVRNNDIRSGEDPRAVPWRQLSNFGPRVYFGFPHDLQPRDPGDPRRALDRLQDPIRFNNSDLASFSPEGTSTPGSLYVTDGRNLAVVRVLGMSGRVKVLRWDRSAARWR